MTSVFFIITQKVKLISFIFHNDILIFFYFILLYMYTIYD